MLAYMNEEALKALKRGRPVNECYELAKKSKERPDESINNELKTGKIEIFANEIDILNELVKEEFTNFFEIHIKKPEEIGWYKKMAKLIRIF